MRTYKIYLLRHGVTQANLEGRYVGRTDVPLCKAGVQEIEGLLKECEYPNVGRVYSSPLLRCTETAKLIYPAFEPVIVENLQEYDFGEFENKTIEELIGNENYAKWIDNNLDIGLSGAENMQAFKARIVDALDSIIIDMMRTKLSDAAVITHGGVIMQLLAHCGLPQRKPISWGTGNGRGYTLLVNASLWGNNKMVEVFTELPYKSVEPIADESEDEYDDDEYGDE